MLRSLCAPFLPAKWLLLGCGLLFVSHTFAQDKSDVDFFNVKPADFNIDLSKVDTSTGAVVIADIGSSSFEGNNKGWFSLIYTRKRRIKILSSKGYPLATHEISLYRDPGNRLEVQLTSLKAATYQLVNGQVVTVKLDKESVFQEKIDKNRTIKKFTLPSVKEGTIIEYSYSIKSDYLQFLQPWNFQCDYPTLWSEYQVDIPEFFIYVSMAQGFMPFYINSSKAHAVFYRIRELSDDGIHDDNYSISSTNTISRFVIKDVPPLKEEKFTSTIDNYMARIEFQQSATNFKRTGYRSRMGTWKTVADLLLKDEDFGAPLSSNNGWMNDELKSVIGNAAPNLATAKAIFSYFRNTYKYKGRQNIYLSQTLKETMKLKTGFAADLNLLLVAMLRHAGFTANPVILGTRDHGFTHEIYPLINRFNYTVAQLKLDDATYYLDAAHPEYGFNHLPPFCYNGHARSITENPLPVYFYADSLKESNLTSVMLFSDEKKPGSWTGTYRKSTGLYEGASIRESVRENGVEGYIKKTKDKYGTDFAIDEVSLDGLKEEEDPITVSYKLDLNLPVENQLIYINPMLKEGEIENDFKSAKRLYPVEMPFATHQVYLFKLEIPAGYVVDEIPKSAKVLLNETEGYFEYMVQQSDQEVLLRSTIQIKKATFLPEDYDSIRSFFDYVVKKHAEQIVLKKK